MVNYGPTEPEVFPGDFLTSDMCRFFWAHVQTHTHTQSYINLIYSFNVFRRDPKGPISDVSIVMETPLPTLLFSSPLSPLISSASLSTCLTVFLVCLLVIDLAGRKSQLCVWTHNTTQASMLHRAEPHFLRDLDLLMPPSLPHTAFWTADLRGNPAR